MKTLIKTLAVLTAGVGAVAVAKRASNYEPKEKYRVQHYGDKVPSNKIKQGDYWLDTKNNILFKAIYRHV